jgi:hypothetical protein
MSGGRCDLVVSVGPNFELRTVHKKVRKREAASGMPLYEAIAIDIEHLARLACDFDGSAKVRILINTETKSELRHCA